MAEQIHSGANKSVCAWVICDDITIVDLEVEEKVSVQGFPVYYNPRELPYWHTSKLRIHDFDNTSHFMMMSEGKQLYCITHK